MAKNTPDFQQQIHGTTAQLGELTGKPGTLAFDLSKKAVVGFDGVKAGGYPSALEERKIQSGTTALKVNGGTEADLSRDITLTIDDTALGSPTWAKRVNGAVPEDDAELQEIIADVPHGGLVYFTEGENPACGGDDEPLDPDIPEGDFLVDPSIDEVPLNTAFLVTEMPWAEGLTFQRNTPFTNRWSSSISYGSDQSAIVCGFLSDGSLFFTKDYLLGLNGSCGIDVPCYTADNSMLPQGIYVIYLIGSGESSYTEIGGRASYACGYKFSTRELTAWSNSFKMRLAFSLYGVSYNASGQGYQSSCYLRPEKLSGSTVDDSLISAAVIRIGLTLSTQPIWLPTVPAYPVNPNTSSVGESGRFLNDIVFGSSGYTGDMFGKGADANTGCGNLGAVIIRKVGD